MNLDGQYWSNRYLNNEAAWDIGNVSTPIKEYVDQLTNKDLNILIPGCGNAYEAEYLLQKGFTSITLIDISEVLSDSLRKKFAGEDRIKIITGDFFELKGEYDLIIEQTFLSALDPSLREKYTGQMFNLLKPGGKLVGIIFSRHFDENPPFGGSKEEYQEMFSKNFTDFSIEDCYTSIERRAGTEVFIKAKKPL